MTMVTADAIPVEPTDYACIDINSGQRCVNRGGGYNHGGQFIPVDRPGLCLHRHRLRVNQLTNYPPIPFILPDTAPYAHTN